MRLAWTATAVSVVLGVTGSTGVPVTAALVESVPTITVVQPALQADAPTGPTTWAALMAPLAAGEAAGIVGTDPMVAADRRAWVRTATEVAAAQAVQVAADAGITQAVVTVDRRTGQLTSAVNADQQFASMSLVKLFIAADVMTADVTTAGAPIDASTEAQLAAMVSTSDDGIASLYYDRQGGGALIDRVAARYELVDTSRAEVEEWWGDVQTSAEDVASFLAQVLQDPVTSSWFTATMTASTDIAADGQDQNFGMNAVVGAASKQGWGCCLSGVLSIHSAGFTDDTIVVVLSDTQPGVAEQETLTRMTTATVEAVLGLPAVPSGS